MAFSLSRKPILPITLEREIRTPPALSINGRIRRHHRDMLRYHWRHMGYLKETIEELEKQIDPPLSPDRKEVELLDGIPGVNKAAAATFIAGMGVNLTVFKSAKHLAHGLV
ncbi:hypothetical protein [Peribacillus butanolivorans]|uniref:hypothetical protein n=1 Tax=Peribacillus butanolivorans TaxID=421767 RepID=UPI00207CF699|nr:hypothetical protein [Peribacillus butanolivorans]